MDKFTIKINNLIDLLKMANESHINEDYKKQADIMAESSRVFLDLSLENGKYVVECVVKELNANETKEN